MIKLEYKSLEEKERIISEQAAEGTPLYGEENILEGNFLLFGKPEPEPPKETDLIMDYVVDVDYRVTMIELGL